jgi:polyhydroxybutyrate depolymerase
MKRLFIAMLVLVQFSPAAYGQGQTLNKSLTHDGISRNYTIYVPSGYTPQNSAPLVVNLHGYTLNRGFQMTYSGMNAVAEREGFLVAYPDAVSGDWFGPQDNIGFIDRVLDEVSSQYSIDPAKVYATGYSQGGMMSYLLSVERPYTFAAIASVGGTRPRASDDVDLPPNIESTPGRPFPLLHIHGTGDPIVPYNGGVSTVAALTLNFPPVERLVHDYVRSNGGDLMATIVDLPNTNSADGTTVQLLSYDGGSYLDAAGNTRPAEVLLYRIQNGGHNWPGDATGWPGFAVPVNYDISASNEIWKFFSRHEVAAIPEPGCLMLALIIVAAVQCRRGVAAGCRCRRPGLSR